MNQKSVLGLHGSKGKLELTRRGYLKVNRNGVLETGSGHIVQADGGGPITVPQGFKISFSPSGTLYAYDPAQQGVPVQQAIAQLMMRDASNTNLIKRNDGLFAVDESPPGTKIANGT